MAVEKLTEFHGKFLSFLRRRVADEAAAEDILQSAYMKTMQHAGDIRNHESSVAWFYRILRNAVIDHYRRRATQQSALEAFATEYKESYEPELQSEICSCINGVVQELKPEYRAAIEEVDLAGGTVEAFAKSAGTTPNNASVRLYRARKAVAKQLAAICGVCAEHKCLDCTCKRHKV